MRQDSTRDPVWVKRVLSPSAHHWRARISRRKQFAPPKNPLRVRFDNSGDKEVVYQPLRGQPQRQ